jgi:mRNA interferase RelE/StbE
VTGDVILGYQILYHRNINKDLKKLDKKIVDLFFSAVKEKILKDPYIGVKLKGRYRNLWKYRIGDFRIIYSIKNGEIKILILRIRHRSNVYDNIYF